MPLPRKAVLGILADNLRKRKSVLPLSRRVTTGWARGLDIPRGGETVLYTGHMYQLIPAISAMAAQMAKLEDTSVTRMMGVGRVFNKLINISRFMARRDEEQQAAYDQTLRSIARLLHTAGVKFGYLYELELYSGALAFDQGIDTVFVDHARRVQKLLTDHGVRNVITVDPHTTQMLRHVYPKVLDDFDVQVRSYLEVLAEHSPEARNQLHGRITIHDSCVYARYEGVIEQPRHLLAKTGLDIVEPELSRSLTHCCGGPIESLFPAKAHEIATKRMAQLTSAGCRIAVMCPICLVNLKAASTDDGPVCADIADILAECFLNTNDSQSSYGENYG